MRIIHEIATAIEFLHEKNIIHNGISTENIAMIPEGRPVLTDFSNIHDASSPPQPHVTLSSYSSPELASLIADPVNTILPFTTSSDIFSLGLLVLELSSGRAIDRGFPFRVGATFGVNGVEVAGAVVGGGGGEEQVKEIMVQMVRWSNLEGGRIRVIPLLTLFISSSLCVLCDILSLTLILLFVPRPPKSSKHSPTFYLLLEGQLLPVLLLSPSSPLPPRLPRTLIFQNQSTVTTPSPSFEKSCEDIARSRLGWILPEWSSILLRLSSARCLGWG